MPDLLEIAIDCSFVAPALACAGGALVLARRASGSSGPTADYSADFPKLGYESRRGNRPRRATAPILLALVNGVLASLLLAGMALYNIRRWDGVSLSETLLIGIVVIWLLKLAETVLWCWMVAVRIRIGVGSCIIAIASALIFSGILIAEKAAGFVTGLLGN